MEKSGECRSRRPVSRTHRCAGEVCVCVYVCVRASWFSRGATLSPLVSFLSCDRAKRFFLSVSLFFSFSHSTMAAIFAYRRCNPPVRPCASILQNLRMDISYARSKMNLAAVDAEMSLEHFWKLSVKKSCPIIEELLQNIKYTLLLLLLLMLLKKKSILPSLMWRILQEYWIC